MGLFNFFSKEKKETLDKGLSKTKESVFSKIARAVAGKSKVDDEVLDNLEEVLITSDVGVETTLNIIKRIEDRVAKDKYVNTQELNKILRDEIAAFYHFDNGFFAYSSVSFQSFGGYAQQILFNLVGIGNNSAFEEA